MAGDQQDPVVSRLPCFPEQHVGVHVHQNQMKCPSKPSVQIKHILDLQSNIIKETLSMDGSTKAAHLSDAEIVTLPFTYIRMCAANTRFKHC